MSAIKTMLAVAIVLASVAFAEEPPTRDPRQVIAQAEETVVFNRKTHKYHCASCRAARICTTNCISVPKSEALERGGVRCHLCGGTCGR
jgi:hypothetical protein